MKKGILVSIVLALVVLCCGCMSFNFGRAIAYGQADPITLYTSFVVTNCSPPSCKVETYSDCISLCNRDCRNLKMPPARKISIVEYGGKKNCMCEEIPLDLSHLSYVGTTSSDDECSRLAFTSGYLGYHYNYGKCSADNKFYSIGIGMTKIECQERVKQTEPDKVFAYVAKTQTCYVVEKGTTRIEY